MATKPIPMSSQTIKIVWENNADTPMNASSLSKSVDYIASYVGYSFIDSPELAGTILKSDTTGDLTPNGLQDISGSLPNTRLILKRGTIFSIINESVDSSGNFIIPINDRYRMFDIGLEDVFITYNERDQGNNPVGWGKNREWYVYICDKDDDSAYNKSNVSEYGGGAQILVSLKRLSTENNVELFPLSSVPGRPLDNYSIRDTRLIGGFKTDDSSFIIPDSVWDIASKSREVKASSYSIIDELGIDYDDNELFTNTRNIINPYRRHVYRPLRPADLDTHSTNRNNVFENTVTINGDFVVGGIDPRPGSNFGLGFDNISKKAELKFSQYSYTESPKIVLNATTNYLPRVYSRHEKGDSNTEDPFMLSNVYMSTNIDGINMEGNISHRNGDVTFNDYNENLNFIIKSSSNSKSLFLDGIENMLSLGIEEPNSRLDIKDEGPMWIGQWRKAIGLHGDSAILFGPDDMNFTSNTNRMIGIGHESSKLHLFDTISVGKLGNSFSPPDIENPIASFIDRNLILGSKQAPKGRLHVYTGVENNIGSYVALSDKIYVEDLRLENGSNIVLKDVSNQWEIGTQSSSSVANRKEGFFIHNRDNLTNTVNSTQTDAYRNYIFITPNGRIGSGTQEPDRDFQIEKDLNSAISIKLLNVNKGDNANSVIEFYNRDTNTTSTPNYLLDSLPLFTGPSSVLGTASTYGKATITFSSPTNVNSPTGLLNDNTVYDMRIDFDNSTSLDKKMFLSFVGKENQTFSELIVNINSQLNRKLSIYQTTYTTPIVSWLASGNGSLVFRSRMIGTSSKVSISSSTYYSSSFSVGLSGENCYSSFNNNAGILTGSSVINGIHLSAHKGGILFSTSDRQSRDLVIYEGNKNNGSNNGFIGMNINKYSSSTTFQDSDGEPEVVLDIRNMATNSGNDTTVFQIKSDLKGSSTVGQRIQGSRDDVAWPLPVDFLDFSNYHNLKNTTYTMARIHSGMGTTDTTNTKGGLVFSTHDGSSLTARTYLTDAGKLGHLTALPDLDLDINGNIGFNEYLYHNNDATADNTVESLNASNLKTYLRFNQAEVQIKAGDIQALWLKKNATAPHVVSIGNLEKSLNKDVNVDVDINSIIYAQGSTGNVRIGNEMPASVASTANLDVSFNDITTTQYLRTTVLNGNAFQYIEGIRSGSAQHSGGLIFRNKRTVAGASYDMGAFYSVTENAVNSKSRINFATNDGTAIKYAGQFNSEQDFIIGFTDITQTSSAKLAVDGGVHIGGLSDPGDNNLTVDNDVYIGNTLNIENETTFNDKIISKTKDSAGGTNIEFNINTTPKYSSLRWKGITSGLEDASFLYLDKSYTSNNVFNAGQFELDSSEGTTIHSANSTGSFNVYIGTMVPSEYDFRINNTNSSFRLGTIVNNSKNSAATSDFIVKSVGNDDMIHSISSTNQVSIGSGTGQPGYQFYVNKASYFGSDTVGSAFFSSSVGIAEQPNTAYKLNVLGGIKFTTSGSNALEYYSTGADPHKYSNISASGFSLNTGFRSGIDFNVNGNTSTTLLKTDSTNNKVGIFTSTPNSIQSGAYNVVVDTSLLVTGAVKFDSSYTLGGTLYAKNGGNTTYGLGSTPSIEVGTSGSKRGIIKIWGTTANEYSTIQTTSNSLHLDSSTTGFLWLQHYSDKDTNINNKLTFGDGTTYDVNLYRSAANVLTTDDSLNITGDVQVTGFTYLRSDIKILNKAGNNWNSFATRSVAQSEATYDLNYISSLDNDTTSANIDVNTKMTFNTNPLIGKATGERLLTIDSTDSWSYISLSKNGVPIWNIGQQNGGQLEFRPGGGDTNKVAINSSGRVEAPYFSATSTAQGSTGHYTWTKSTHDTGRTYSDAGGIGITRGLSTNSYNELVYLTSGQVDIYTALNTKRASFHSTGFTVNGSITVGTAAAANQVVISTGTTVGGTNPISINGYVYPTRVYNAIYNDYAEYMWKKEDSIAEAGDVLVATEEGVDKSTKRAQESVVGVYSDSFGSILFSDQSEKKHPVGMSGTLLVKLHGSAKVGDVLVSYKNGFAVKANMFEKIFKRDAIIGKVINSRKDEKQRIMILIK